MDAKQLGAMLREARRRAGLSQREAAHAAGIKYSTLAHWERGRGLAGVLSFCSVMVTVADAVSAAAATDGKSTTALDARPYGQLIADLASILRVEDDDPLGLHVIKPKRTRSFSRAEMERWQEPMVTGLQRAINAERAAGRRK